jgi:ABC-2 type transport system ATP-binding protein
MTSLAIKTSGLTKVYGSTRALDGVDLSVPEGSVFGFLGPNGAGKTTTLRILTGLARPSSGHARVLGHDVVRAGNDVRGAIGFLPDVPGFYDWMTAEEFLQLAGALFGIKRNTLDERISALLDLAGLAGVEQRIGGYSRGMRQRLGVAQALINAPRLLMLDEPTSALDPLGRKDVLDMIVELRGKTTVFFSTHILADVERVCDIVAILDHGRVVAQSPMDELKARHGGHRVLVEVDGPLDALAEQLARAPWTAGVEREPAEAGAERLAVKVLDRAEARRAIPAAVVSLGLGLVRLAEEEPSLEDVFVELVGDKDTAHVGAGEVR